MARRIAQVIYNTISGNGGSFRDGSAFSKYMPALAVGVQALKLEDNEYKPDNINIRINDSDDIQLGYTGIFELDLTDISQILNLKVIPNENTQQILVDLIYEEAN